jgi:hypothetical protein
MMLLRTILAFCLEWWTQATVGGSSATRIAKIVAFIAVLVLATLGLISHRRAEHEIGWLHVSFSPNGKAEKMVMWTEFTISELVLVLILLVWISIAAGAAAVRFKRVDIGQIIEHDPSNDYYRLSIKNLGFAETDIAVYVEALANDDGIINEQGLQFPFELSWMHQPSANRPLLAKGCTHKVDVFRVAAVGDIPNQTRPVLAFVGRHDRYLIFSDPGSLAKSNLWVALSFANSRDVRWFSIERMGISLHYKVTSGNPRFVENQKLTTRLVKSFGELGKTPFLKRIRVGFDEFCKKWPIW